MSWGACVEKSQRPINIDIDGPDLVYSKDPQHAILDLFTLGNFEAESPGSDMAREAKRQRLNTGSSSAVHSAGPGLGSVEKFDNTSSVVLAKVALELVCRNDLVYMDFVC